MAGLRTQPPPIDRCAASRDQRALVVVSHRGPVRILRRDGRRVVRRNAGGLVTALRDVARHAGELRWICAASSDEDRAVAATTPWIDAGWDDSECRIRMLDIDPATHHEFYAVIANPLLWFVQHNLWDHATAPDIDRPVHAAWNNGYVAVNRRFANVVADRNAVPAGSTVMVHDYHFYLVPALVRARRSDVFLHFFTHIPWPQVDAWRILPPRMREDVFRGLLGSDLVAFQTKGYVRNFLLGCEEVLGAAVDHGRGTVTVDGREVQVRHYPISVDADALGEMAASPAVRAKVSDMDHRRKIILRVDRTDPSKNIVRGFRAYARMLEQHPHLCGNVTFVALLQPSRQDVPQYATYLREVHHAVDAVNERFGTPDWRPVDLRMVDDLPLAVAAYTRFDVLFVNPVADGMNLVAKEGLVVNENDGVLALSESAGAHDELGAIALTVHPFDIDQQAAVLSDALTMPRAERRERREIGADIVRTNNVRKWLERQLADIDRYSCTWSSTHA